MVIVFFMYLMILLISVYLLFRICVFLFVYGMVLLRCVDRNEVTMFIKEIHEGSFGIHANGHTMTKKILRASYYWLIMETDCFHYAKMCHKCQIYANKVHMPSTLLNVLTTP